MLQWHALAVWCACTSASIWLKVCAESYYHVFMQIYCFAVKACAKYSCPSVGCTQ